MPRHTQSSRFWQKSIWQSDRLHVQVRESSPWVQTFSLKNGTNCQMPDLKCWHLSRQTMISSTNKLKSSVRRGPGLSSQPCSSHRSNKPSLLKTFTCDLDFHHFILWNNYFPVLIFNMLSYFMQNTIVNFFLFLILFIYFFFCFSPRSPEGHHKSWTSYSPSSESISILMWFHNFDFITSSVIRSFWGENRYY